MGNFPAINGKKLIAALKKLGFENVRIRGSHHFMAHPDGRCSVVPVHAGETIGVGLLSKILNDCELTRQSILEKL